ncbi:MAG: hypothetical protein KDK30_16445, partial [Leptospiraceae bacterium]|nr:hypothetical protein [Leptospiraceae bacterium]
TITAFEEVFKILKSTDRRDLYDYVYTYLACTYARTGKMTAALKTARQALLLEHEFDAGEPGRSALAIALVLRHRDRLGAKTSQVLSAITEQTGLEESADAYFDRAIFQARTVSHALTLVPTLREYARWLLQKTQADSDSEGEKENDSLRRLALSCLREARTRARSADMRAELRLIEKLALDKQLTLD